MPHFYEIQHALDTAESLAEELAEAYREITRLKQENASYKLWMDRSIARVKEMQA
jgi:hypothetical protein